MKDINDLLAQFEDIQDNEISEEMLGAYLEGNLSADEALQVENAINQDDTLSAFMEDISSLGIPTDDFSMDDAGLDISGLELLDNTSDINLFDDFFDASGHFLGFDVDDGLSNWDQHTTPDDGFDGSSFDESF